MKTTEEAAIEYAKRTDKANAEWVMKDFLAGAAFAQRWIGMNEEVPKKNLPIIFKTERGGTYCGFYSECEFFTEDYEKFHMKDITHWRQIELK